MQIGIVGCGIVGSACKFGFEKLGHKVRVHDLKLNTSIYDLLESEIIYICVPTPMKQDGCCDTTIVESVVDKLSDLYYSGVVAIKSTVPPGTTKSIISKHTKTVKSVTTGSIKLIHPFADIAFVPEFLRERCAISDFVENQKLLAVGANSPVTHKVIVESHGHYPQSVVNLTCTQAEILKYYHNTFNALRVVFANEFFEITKFFEEEYTPIKNALLKTSSIPDVYLDVNDNMRGYSSICWNKDVPAIIKMCEQHGIKIPLTDMIPVANENYEKTPFKGTRE
jgi:UDPglucose 6-dehydrogenase